MPVEPQLDRCLARLERLLGQAEEAAEQTDWRRVRRCVARYRPVFSRVQLFLRGSHGRPGKDLTGTQREALSRCRARLGVLASRLQTWRDDVNAELRMRKRARTMAKAYAPGTITKPKHVRMVSTLVNRERVPEESGSAK